VGSEGGRMSLTILEVLQNAEYNLKNNVMGKFQTDLAIEQLSNAIYLMDEKDKLPHDDFDESDLRGKNETRL
jgi:hypothetical protein